MKHIYLTDCVSIFKVESIIVFIIFLLIKHWDCNQGYFKHREQRFFFFFFFVKYFVKLFDKIFKKSKKKITNGRGKRFPLLAIALSEVQRRPRKRGKKEIDIWTPQEYVLCTLLSTKLRSLWEKGSPEISPCPSSLIPSKEILRNILWCLINAFFEKNWFIWLKYACDFNWSFAKINSF